jgi:RNA polymerase sigma factor (sigma-70 family)
MASYIMPMPEDSDREQEERLLVERCQEGDRDALAELREQNNGSLRNILIARGANGSEAEEVLAEVWAKCVPGGEQHPSLLEKFNANSRLQNWLARVATNRWLDWKRQDKFRGEPPVSADAGSRTEFFYRVPATPKEDVDSTLVGLLRDSLKAAFASCAPESLVLLRLVYLHDVTQREVMRMVGWSESKVSRTLSQALEYIRVETLRELKEREPMLTLTWQDFQDLCESEPAGFL